MPVRFWGSSTKLRAAFFFYLLRESDFAHEFGEARV
jgi:hypothetical protein